MTVGITPTRRSALLALVAGLALAAWAQWSGPLAHPPVYDGVAVVDPYRYLAPAAGQPGHPGDAAATLRVSRGHVSLAAVSTPESPPQAQIFAPNDAFALPVGSTEVRISIRPVSPPGMPIAGHIAGNVYRFTVTNQAGVPLRALAKAQVSLILRAPQGANDVRIERWDGHAWAATRSSRETLSMFLVIVTDFGDYAAIVPGSAPSQAAAVPSTAESAAPPQSAPPQPAPGGGSGSDAFTIPVVLGVLVAALVALFAWQRHESRRTGPRR